jgi:hypothetical protein
MNDISETSGVTATAAPPPPANHETEVKNTEISAQDRSVVIEMKFIDIHCAVTDGWFSVPTL